MNSKNSKMITGKKKIKGSYTKRLKDKYKFDYSGDIQNMKDYN